MVGWAWVAWVVWEVDGAWLGSDLFGVGGDRLRLGVGGWDGRTGTQIPNSQFLFDSVAGHPVLHDKSRSR